MCINFGFWHVFAAGIDDIRNEFIICCKKFKYNDAIVEKIDKTICYKNHVDKICEAPLGEVLKYYCDLFRSNTGNCRVTSAYFSTRFDSEAIENREINVILGRENMHTANLYKIGDKWYVADFIMAIKHPQNAAEVFAIPLESFILSVGDSDTGKRALAFGVYNKTDRGGMDLGEFIPEIQPLLSTHHFMVYVGSRTDMLIEVRPRLNSNSGMDFMTMFSQIFFEGF